MGVREQMDYGKAYRENRMQAAQWILNHPESFQEVLEIGFENHPELSHRAWWAFEFACLERLDLLYPHFDYFFQNLGSVKGDSSVRPIAHISEVIVLHYYKKKDETLQKIFLQKHKESLTEVCFDWLITDQKVACQARAMLCLYYLGKELNWIHNELKVILERNIPMGSAGYKNRAAKILSALNNDSRLH